MRLPERIKNSILQSAQENFGPVSVYLFGSRTDDTLRGGDIDIAIDTTLPHELFRKKRVLFYTTLLKKGCNLKIDLVQYNPLSSLLINKEIDSSKIKL
ncbi:MAG: nucleotidyltransferase domain-containing protein [Spirochaetia bacterium]|nr:nucleotidyltransferase domain-containing protein [Spirochaetia bacterium]